MARRFCTAVSFFTALFLWYPVYSEYSQDINATMGIDRTFIQNEINEVNAQIADINAEIKDLNSRKKAFEAQISILRTQNLLEGLAAKGKELDSKISAVAGNGSKVKAKLNGELTELNKETAIRGEMLELYKLQLGGEKNMRKGKGRNLRNIQEQLKIREGEIETLYPAKIVTDTPTVSMAPEAPAIVDLLERIKIIDDRVALERKKIETLVKKRTPLILQLKGI
jgi:hypothetical protein